jgi:ATP-dependent Zn protease
MVAELGMGEALGLRFTDGRHPLSPALAADVDEETRQVLGAQDDRAVALQEHRPVLERVAPALLAEEVLDRPRFLELLG